MSKRIPLEGKKFGKLYVKEYIGNGKYNCVCECGNECYVYKSNLVSNHTTSCGCNKLTSDLTNQTFGFLRVIKRTVSKTRGSQKRAMWECECLRCGGKINVYADSFSIWRYDLMWLFGKRQRYA